MATSCRVVVDRLLPPKWWAYLLRDYVLCIIIIIIMVVDMTTPSLIFLGRATGYIRTAFLAMDWARGII
eukprot:scaffold7166_cov104-Skeletonema_dohrnii-CCMP3373.AAC.3